MLHLILRELAVWFPGHASMMDAALAAVLAERSFDTETGRVGLPRAPEAALITGCGGDTCS